MPNFACQAENYTHALQLSNEMLHSAEQGNWEALINLNMDYLPRLEAALRDIQEQTFSAEERASIADSLQILWQNEQTVMALLKSRMDDLRHEIASLHKSQQCNRAYSTLLVQQHENAWL